MWLYSLINVFVQSTSKSCRCFGYRSITGSFVLLCVNMMCILKYYKNT